MTRPGEGILLGGILTALIIGVMVYTGTENMRKTTVEPIHSMDIIVTKRPPVNINTADAETLSTLRGIGESIALRIVDRREENGPFSSVEELLEVTGIGEAKLALIRDDICIN